MYFHKYCNPYLVTVQKVWVRRVHITRLHPNLAVNTRSPRVDCQYSRDHIGHQLRRRGHGSLEEVYNYAVEPLSQRGVPPERLLEVTYDKSVPSPRGKMNSQSC